MISPGRVPGQRFHVKFAGPGVDMQPFSCILSSMVADHDKVFKALADSSRRQLLDRLRQEGGLTLSDLCQGHDMSRQAVTKHLVLLEQANLVISVKQGRAKLHYLNPVPSTTSTCAGSAGSSRIGFRRSLT